jgi:TP53 regulating kinase-like protein
LYGGEILDSQILALGAESQISIVNLWGRKRIIKHRPKKDYLLREIDEQLRATRTSRECRMLTVARSLGVPTPAVYAVDLHNMSFIMDFLEGDQLKTLVGTVSQEKLDTLSQQFGHLMGLLHLGDMVHGDPTTSNIIVDSTEKMWVIDFGLAELNATIEMKGVDLHLVRRALETTHWDHQDSMLASVLRGYANTVGNQASQVFSRMDEIRERGRYH